MSCLQSNTAFQYAKYQLITATGTLAHLGHKLSRFYSVKINKKSNFLWQQYNHNGWRHVVTTHTKLFKAIQPRMHCFQIHFFVAINCWILTPEAVDPYLVSNRLHFVCGSVLGPGPCHIFCLVNFVVALLLNTIVNLVH